MGFKNRQAGGKAEPLVRSVKYFGLDVVFSGNERRNYRLFMPEIVVILLTLKKSPTVDICCKQLQVLGFW